MILTYLSGKCITDNAGSTDKHITWEILAALGVKRMNGSPLVHCDHLRLVVAGPYARFRCAKIRFRVLWIVFLVAQLNSLSKPSPAVRITEVIC